MTKLVTAYYSKKTGARTTDGFALRNPNYVNALTLDPNFLRGKTIKIASDGMPANWAAAEKAKLAWDVHQAKLDARRKTAAAKKAAKKVAAVTTTKTVKKAAQKKQVKKAVKKVARKKPAVALPAVPPAPVL
ncbi:hypothetical protein [Xanthomonas phage RTH11]|nr:hypothetical protein [Xanthomonas phage RTH11]